MGPASELASQAPDDRDWPRTQRTKPWLAAGLLLVLFLVPIDSSKLPIPFPADARPDRIAMVAVLGLAVLASLEQAAGRRRSYRYGLVEAAMIVFFAAAVFSVAFNLHLLEVQGELDQTTKRFAVLIAFGAFFLLIVHLVRPSEVPMFIRFIVAIATVAAAGTILQYVTSFNIFYWAMDKFSPPGTSVAPYRFILLPGGRPDITGPTRHGLAVSTMLAMILPFAVVGSVHATAPRERLLYRLAALVVFVGCLATLRRSGVILPFVSTSAVIFLGGRRMLPVVGAFLVLLVVAPIVAPGAVAQIRDQFSSNSVTARRSIGGRTSDYSATKPEIVQKALIGRGYGSYDANKYRFLDNQYLGLLISVGTIGTASYVGLIVIGALLALRLSIRQRRAGRDPSIALACFGSIVAYAVANALFDTLAFPQAPYAFFLILAIVSITRRDDTTRLPATHPLAHPKAEAEAVLA